MSRCLFKSDRECFHNCPKCFNKITLKSGYKSSQNGKFITQSEAYEYALNHIEEIPKQDLIDFFFDNQGFYETEEE